MRIRASAVGTLLCSLAAGSAHAHGVVGQRTFIEPFIAEDVNPKNEFVIGRPEWDHSRNGRTLSLGFGLEKKLSDRFRDRKSTRLNSSHSQISYAVFCLKKKKKVHYKLQQHSYEYQ